MISPYIRLFEVFLDECLLLIKVDSVVPEVKFTVALHCKFIHKLFCRPSDSHWPAFSSLETPLTSGHK